MPRHSFANGHRGGVRPAGSDRSSFGHSGPVAADTTGIGPGGAGARGRGANSGRPGRLRWLATTAVAAVLALSTVGAGAQTQPECLIDFGPITEHLRGGATTVHDGPVTASAHLGSHGQLIFGEEAVYLHHLPFLLTSPDRHPHNFQVLMRVAFADADERQAYLDRRAELPDALFTVLPAPFTQDGLRQAFEEELTGLNLGDVAVFDEHFENPSRPQPFVTAGMVIEEVVQFVELDPADERSTELAYLILENGAEAHLVHVLSAPPDFDQVLAVSLTRDASGPLSDLSLDGGLLRMLAPANDEAERLRVGDTLTCSAHDGTRRLPFDVAVSVDGEVYCEAGELSAVAGSPDFEGKRACE